MSRRWLTRAIVALAVPALTVPALATSASAVKGPDVPSVAHVTKIYPHLDGEAYESSSKVHGIGKNCKQGKAIKGASATSVSYMPGDPADYASTAAKPSAYVSAMKFRSAKSAIAYLHASDRTVKCPVTNPGGGGSDIDVKIKKIRFKLGDERQGWTLTATSDEFTMVSHSLLVRKGKHIVVAGVSAMDGGTPSVKKALKLTKLAVTAAS